MWDMCYLEFLNSSYECAGMTWGLDCVSYYYVLYSPHCCLMKKIRLSILLDVDVWAVLHCCLEPHIYHVRNSLICSAFTFIVRAIWSLTRGICSPSPRLDHLNFTLLSVNISYLKYVTFLNYSNSTIILSIVTTEF